MGLMPACSWDLHLDITFIDYPYLTAPPSVFPALNPNYLPLSEGALVLGLWELLSLWTETVSIQPLCWLDYEASKGEDQVSLVHRFSSLASEGLAPGAVHVFVEWVNEWTLPARSLQSRTERKWGWMKSFMAKLVFRLIFISHIQKKDKMANAILSHDLGELKHWAGFGIPFWDSALGGKVHNSEQRPWLFNNGKESYLLFVLICHIQHISMDDVSLWNNRCSRRIKEREWPTV